MKTITLKTTAKVIQTKCRTPRGIWNAWTSGAIALDVTEFHGAEIWQNGKKIGVIVAGGWEAR